MVLEAIDGETIARKIQRDDDFAARAAPARCRLGHALAKIHSIDPTTVHGLESIDQLAYYTDVLDSLGQPHPVLELVRNWLVDTRRRPADGVVHGDFRLGNVIVGPDGLRAVIDWELAHLGDPMEDLGWVCVKAWRFGGGPPVAGLGDYDELFDAYEGAGGVGRSVVVHWWEVLGTWKWARHVHPPGQRPSLRDDSLPRARGDRPARVRERVRPVRVARWTVVTMGAHTTLPTAIELLEAVREWIDREVHRRPPTDGYASTLASPRTCWRWSSARSSSDLPRWWRTHARFAQLGVADDAELAAAIRERRFDAPRRRTPLAPRRGRRRQARRRQPALRDSTVLPGPVPARTELSDGGRG